jgi:hypothetical protein
MIGEGKGWLQGDLAKGVATTIAGGVGSVIAGGKFENGAMTAAMGYLYNHLNTFNSKGSDAYLRDTANTFQGFGEDPNRYDVYGHGNAEGMWRVAEDGKWSKISVDELVTSIKEDPRWRPGMEVKIWACNLAAAEAYVQQVANGLNSPITVADKYVWFSNGEVPYVAGSARDWFGSSGSLARSMLVRLNLTFDFPTSAGGWRTIKPR